MLGTELGQRNVIVLRNPTSKVCSRKHDGPGANVRGHRMTLGKEDTHGLRAGAEVE